MGIEKMMLVNIAGQVNKLDLVISKCIKSKCFHLENVYSTISQMEVDVYQLNEKNPYRESLKKMMSIDFSEKFEFNEVDFSEINSKSLEEIDKYISNLELSSGFLFITITTSFFFLYPFSIYSLPVSSKVIYSP